MTDSNATSDRGRSMEDDYFRRRDRELIERMRAATAAEESRRKMISLTGLQESDVQELEHLGFTPDTIVLLPLVPLLQVAWAEGGVSPEERTLIVDLARARGITDGSAADAQLTRWLSVAPSSTVYDGASRLITALLGVEGSVGWGMTADDLVAHCERVAAASGGFLGIKKVSAEERELLSKLSHDLKNRAT